MKCDLIQRGFDGGIDERMKRINSYDQIVKMIVALWNISVRVSYLFDSILLYRNFFKWTIQGFKLDIKNFVGMSYGRILFSELSEPRSQVFHFKPTWEFMNVADSTKLIIISRKQSCFFFNFLKPETHVSSGYRFYSLLACFGFVLSVIVRDLIFRTKELNWISNSELEGSLIYILAEFEWWPLVQGPTLLNFGFSPSTFWESSTESLRDFKFVGCIWQFLFRFTAFATLLGSAVTDYQRLFQIIGINTRGSYRSR